MKTFKTNKDELFEIFLRNKIPAKNFTPIPHGNINEIYLVNSLYCNKYILRILNIKTLNNELFFYYKCSQLDIPVIKIFFSGRLKDNRDYYVMEYIESDEINISNRVKVIKEAAKNLKIIHSIKLKGFGKIINNELENTLFSHSSINSWLKEKVEYILPKFDESKDTNIVKLLQRIGQNINSIVSKQDYSSLIHSDFRIENFLIKESKVYLIDPGEYPAMPFLFDIAVFENKYFMSLGDRILIDTFYKEYFKNKKLSKKDKLELITYRIIVAALVYCWYLEENKNTSYKKERLLALVNRYSSLYY